MADLLFGVWDGERLDTRRQYDESKVPNWARFEGLVPDNNIRVFIADRGFLVFDETANLTDAFHHYMSRVSAESCGKCTPCRVGTSEIRDRLAALGGGLERDAALTQIRLLAEQVVGTSLCGLGQSCGRSLIEAIRHFPAAFGPAQGATAQNAYAYTTAPCIEACPAKLDVPRYIDYVKNGQPDHALGVVLEKYPLAASCGRVCVRFCESACRRTNADGAVGIKMLKRYVADQAMDAGREIRIDKPAPDALAAGKRVAIVGAGPAGVTCAYHLLLAGFQVDVLEAYRSSGGMASVGIPSYRLPKDVLKAETEDIIRRLGGRIHYGRRLGKDFTVDSLRADGYDSVFLGFGASRGTLLGVENEDPTLKGYASGVDFLLAVHEYVEHGKPMQVAGEVVVVGGGNVAMDCVRSALRMGAKKVHLIYRRTLADMPADHEEVVASQHEGVEFHCLANPSRLVIEQGRVVGVELLKMRQTEPDAKGRIGVEAIPNSEHRLSCSLVIAAIGQQVERGLLSEADGITTDRWGCIQVDPDSLQTARDGVFAGGDCVLGPLTLIHAMDQGARAAASIRDYLLHGQVLARPDATMQKLLASAGLARQEALPVPPMASARALVPELPAEERIAHFEEVEQVISKEEAYREAERCLRCYRVYSVVTDKPLAAPPAIHLDCVQS
ncbi:MAG TPA: FAD-dependent oxidoreductase [Azonexus sp.]|nr:FAD-dependent oxidoreductase [Azonexus sp.]